jgi:ATP-binding cassette, subfamily C (CFTR/MRP), member 1
MTPLMKYGHKAYLNSSDLWGLRKKDRASVTCTSFSVEWDRQLSKKKPSVTWAIARAYGRTYAIAAIFKMSQDILAFVQPQLLRMLLAYVNNFDRETSSPVKGFAIALTMFLVSVTQTSLIHQYFQRCFEFGMRTKSGVTAAIYKKSLALSNDGRQAKSTGDVVNLMSVDTQRLQDVSQYAQVVWSAPFQITLCLFSLYNLVGPSMLAGIGIMIIMIPINGIISRIMKKYQRQQMKVHSTKTLFGLFCSKRLMLGRTKTLAPDS